MHILFCNAPPPRESYYKLHSCFNFIIQSFETPVNKKASKKSIYTIKRSENTKKQYLLLWKNLLYKNLVPNLIYWAKFPLKGGIATSRSTERYKADLFFRYSVGVYLVCFRKAVQNCVRSEKPTSAATAFTESEVFRKSVFATFIFSCTNAWWMVVPVCFLNTRFR